MDHLLPPHNSRETRSPKLASTGLACWEHRTSHSVPGTSISRRQAPDISFQKADFEEARPVFCIFSSRAIIRNCRRFSFCFRECLLSGDGSFPSLSLSRDSAKGETLSLTSAANELHRAGKRCDPLTVGGGPAPRLPRVPAMPARSEIAARHLVLPLSPHPSSAPSVRLQVRKEQVEGCRGEEKPLSMAHGEAGLGSWNSEATPSL